MQGSILEGSEVPSGLGLGDEKSYPELQVQGLRVGCKVCLQLVAGAQQGRRWDL